MALRAQGSKSPWWPFTHPIFCRFLPESDNIFDAATYSVLPMEALGPVNRHSRWLPFIGTSQQARTVASHEDRPALRKALAPGTELGGLARKSSTAPSSLRRTARGRVARRPAHGSSGTCWPLLEGHFVALIGSGAQQVGAELRKQGVTARTWTEVDQRNPVHCEHWHVNARTVDCVRLLWLHTVSEESVASKVLRRLRPLKGPLLVECGRSFFSRQEITKMRSRPEVETHKFPLVAPKTARGHSDFVLTSGPCGFARDTILVQFQQSKMSQETTYSTLSASGAFLGARSCGAFATRNDGEAHASHDAHAFQFVHLFSPSEQLIGVGWLAASCRCDSISE